MPVVINTNVASLGVQSRLSQTDMGMATALRRLSSGLRVNTAKDDAAGLAVSERMQAQVRGMRQAVRNVNDGISVLQTAEAATGEMTAQLQRVRELALQSLNDTISPADRLALDGEAQRLLKEVDRVAASTSFNRKSLLDGSAGQMRFQVGAGSGDTLDVDLSTSLRASEVGAISFARTADLRTTNNGGGGGFAFTGTYTTTALPGLDFSKPDAPLVPGRATATVGVVNYAGGQASSFTVDGVPITLDANYGSVGGVAGAIQQQLNAAQNGAYAVTQNGAQITVAKTASASNAAAAVSMAATGGPNAGAFASAAGVAGSPATRNTRAGFSVDGNHVALSADYSGNMGGLLAEIQRQLDASTGRRGVYQVSGSEAGISVQRVGSHGTPVVNGFTDNGAAVFARSASSYLTLSEGDLTVQVGDGKAVSITGRFSSAEELSRMVQSRAPGTVAAVNQLSGALEISATETLTLGGTQAQPSGSLAFESLVNEASGSLADANVRDARSARTMVLRVDAALKTFGTQRALLGATQSRLEAVVGSLEQNVEATSAARGRIVDADYASETAALTSAQMLRKAGMAILAQLNVGPRDVLALLQGLSG